MAAPASAADPDVAVPAGVAVDAANLKRTLKKLVRRIEKFRDAHGTVPSRNRIFRWQKKLPYQLNSGAVTRVDTNEYCVWYWTGPFVTYDSVLDKYWFRDRRAADHQGGICRDWDEGRRRQEQTYTRTNRLGKAMRAYVKANGELPETMGPEDQATVGYELPAGWAVASYVVKPWPIEDGPGLTVRFCVEHENGGYAEHKLLYDEEDGTADGRNTGPYRGDRWYWPCP